MALRLSGFVRNSQLFDNRTPTITSQKKPDDPGNGGGGGNNGGGGNSGPSDNQAPTVAILVPIDGNTITYRDLVPIVVKATDDIGVTSVDIFIDGQMVIALPYAPYVYMWDTSNTVDGPHTITATARDAALNSSTAAITIFTATAEFPPILTPPSPDLPTSYLLDTPVPGNQMNEGSCCAFATVYSARSIEHYYDTGAINYSPTTNIFSVEYVFNQALITPGNCYSGTSIGLCLDLMKNLGVCLEATMPQADGDCSIQPDGTQHTEADLYKINSYAKIENTDMAAIKYLVTQNHPVIASIVYDNSFINAAPGFIWDHDSGSGCLPHMGVIVGYDDAKGAYKIMNSWGTSWGDAGFGWIDYDFFPTVAGFYVYVINY